MTFSRWALSAVIAILIAAFFLLDLHRYFTLETLNAQQAVIETYRNQHPVLAIGLYALIYVAVTGLSLPGAAILTLAGGAFFISGCGRVPLCRPLENSEPADG